MQGHSHRGRALGVSAGHWAPYPSSLLRNFPFHGPVTLIGRSGLQHVPSLDGEEGRDRRVRTKGGRASRRGPGGMARGDVAAGRVRRGVSGGNVPKHTERKRPRGRWCPQRAASSWIKRGANCSWGTDITSTLSVALDPHAPRECRRVIVGRAPPTCPRGVASRSAPPPSGPGSRLDTARLGTFRPIPVGPSPDSRLLT